MKSLRGQGESASSVRLKRSHRAADQAAPAAAATSRRGRCGSGSGCYRSSPASRPTRAEERVIQRRASDCRRCVTRVEPRGAGEWNRGPRRAPFPKRAREPGRAKAAFRVPPVGTWETGTSGSRAAHQLENAGGSAVDRADLEARLATGAVVGVDDREFLRQLFAGTCFCYRRLIGSGGC